MCEFYTIGVHRPLGRARYKWVLRLDLDSRLPSPIGYSLVEHMRAAGRRYGYVARAYGTPSVARNLLEYTALYLDTHRIEAPLLLAACKPAAREGVSLQGWNKEIFYNNFFLTDISWWLQPHVAAFADYLRASGGFFVHRWGDAPVQTVIVKALMAQDQVEQLAGFRYQHDLRDYGSAQGPGGAAAAGGA